VENNYGYRGLARTSRAPHHAGIERVDINERGHRLPEGLAQRRAGTFVVPKLSLPAVSFNSYTKPPIERRHDAWYFTAIDFRTGRTVYKRLAGTGLGFNNNYAPVTIGPRAQPTSARWAGSPDSGTADEPVERPEDPPDRRGRHSPTVPAARSGSRGSPARCSRTARSRDRRFHGRPATAATSANAQSPARRKASRPATTTTSRLRTASRSPIRRDAREIGPASSGTSRRRSTSATASRALPDRRLEHRIASAEATPRAEFDRTNHPSGRAPSFG